MGDSIEIVWDDGSVHNSVQVSGEFTSWVPKDLPLQGGTRYASSFKAASGAQFKFLVDSEWKLLPGLPVSMDNIGNENHYVVASTSPTSAPPGGIASGVEGTGHYEQPTKLPEAKESESPVVETPNKDIKAKEVGESLAQSGKADPVSSEPQDETKPAADAPVTSDDGQTPTLTDKVEHEGAAGVSKAEDNAKSEGKDAKEVLSEKQPPVEGEKDDDRFCSCCTII